MDNSIITVIDATTEFKITRATKFTLNLDGGSVDVKIDTKGVESSTNITEPTEFTVVCGTLTFTLNAANATLTQWS